MGIVEKSLIMFGVLAGLIAVLLMLLHRSNDRLKKLTTELNTLTSYSSHQQRKLKEYQRGISDVDVDVSLLRMLERLAKDSNNGLAIMYAGDRFELVTHGHMWLDAQSGTDRAVSGWHESLLDSATVLFSAAETNKASARQEQSVRWNDEIDPTLSTPHKCSLGHTFAIYPNHPRRDGQPRCPYCLAAFADGLLVDRHAKVAKE